MGLIQNSLISLGKYGSFQVNQILGRPFYKTFEILDKAPEIVDGNELRIIPAAELHADALITQSETPGSGEYGATPSGEYEDAMLTEMRTNKEIYDDPMNQKLTMAEIEALKQDEAGTAKELIAKIMESHSTLDQKGAFSLAKYTLKKNKKYLRRFCVLPLDVTTLTDWMMIERDFGKVMEIRNEVLGLIGCWANVHSAGWDPGDIQAGDLSSRYLVVDDTGGLIVAAMAERMGILHPPGDLQQPDSDIDDVLPSVEPVSDCQPPRRPHPEELHMSATYNTLTLIHSNSQPNLALLRYFSYDPNTPSPAHPLYTRLKTLSWLQLLSPSSDPVYHEPEVVPPEILSSWKSSKRSTHYRKRRRWARIKSVIDTTRAGDFDGLVISSFTNPTSILHHAVPLLRGGAQIVVYSPHIEPLTQLADFYSTARRTAFINTPVEDRRVPTEDFPVDPTLLLAPTLQTARARKWQVLPGRTHPLMMARGGAEGYVWVGTRVEPVEGKVEARGRAGKRRKVEKTVEVGGTAAVIGEDEIEGAKKTRQD